MLWAERYLEFMDPEGNDLFYHETPIHYIVPELVPRTLANKLHVYELMSLHGRIETTIYNGDSCCASRLDYDWHAAKERVERVLNEYGESLANVQQRGRKGDQPGNSD